MKLLKHFAMAAALFSASAASAEVVNSVYDFESYTENEPVAVITDPAIRAGDGKQNNIQQDGNNWTYGTIKAYEGGKYAYNDEKGCIVATIWNDVNNNYGGNINKIASVVDLGGTTGKVLAIVGSANPTYLNEALKKRGLDVTLEGTQNIGQWNLYFFLQPENKITYNTRVTIRLSVFHNDESEVSSHLINQVYARGYGGNILNEFTPAGQVCSAHNHFMFDEWTEMSFVVTPGQNESFEFLQFNFAGWGNLGNSVLFIKDIIVERVDDTVSSSGSNATYNSTFFSVGLGFDEYNKKMSVGETDTDKTVFTPKYVLENEPLRYISSDESVATVDPETGKVTAKGFGSAVITAEYVNGNVFEDYTIGDGEHQVFATRARYTVFVTDPYIHARQFAYTIDDVLPEYSQFTFTTTGTKWHGGYETQKEDPDDPDVIAGEPTWKGGHCDFPKGATMDIAMEGRNIIKVEIAGEQLNNLSLDATNWNATTNTNTFKVFEAGEEIKGSGWWNPGTPAGNPLKVAWKNEASTYGSTSNAVINTVTVYYEPQTADIKIVPVVTEPETEEASTSLTLPAVHENYKMQYAVKSEEQPQSIRRRAITIASFSDDDFQDMPETSDAYFTKNDDGSYTHNYQDSKYTIAFRAVNKTDANDKTDIVLHEVTNEKDETGIETVAAENDAPAVYYNLQGVRVEGTPDAGLYIEVKGNTSRKVRL